MSINLDLLKEYFSIIQNNVLSVSSRIKYNFYHKNMLLDAFQTNSHNIIGRNLLIVIPLLANQDLMPILVYSLCKNVYAKTFVMERVITSVKQQHLFTFQHSDLKNFHIQLKPLLSWSKGKIMNSP